MAVPENPASSRLAFGQFFVPYGGQRARPCQSAGTHVGNRPRPARSQHCPADLHSYCDFLKFRVAAHPVELWRVFDSFGFAKNRGFYSEGNP